MFLSRGDRDLGVAFQTHLRSQAWYIGEAKNSALLSSDTGMSGNCGVESRVSSGVSNFKRECGTSLETL